MVLSDSVRYSVQEDSAITNGLIELKLLRAEIIPLRKPAGYYRAYRSAVDSLLNVYEDKRAFLGIGSRKQKRGLRKQIQALP